MVTSEVHPPDLYGEAKLAKLSCGVRGPLGPQSGHLRVVTVDARCQGSGSRGGC